MKKIRRSAKMVTEMSMASMSDIAFLLIIFFMVTSVFALREGLHLTLPDRSRAPVIVSASDVVTVSLSGEGSLSYNGKQLEESFMVEKLREVREQNPKLAVLLKIAPEAKYDRSVSVIDSIRTAGIKRLTIRLN